MRPFSTRQESLQNYSSTNLRTVVLEISLNEHLYSRVPWHEIVFVPTTRFSFQTLQRLSGICRRFGSLQEEEWSDVSARRKPRSCLPHWEMVFLWRGTFASNFVTLGRTTKTYTKTSSRRWPKLCRQDNAGGRRDTSRASRCFRGNGLIGHLLYSRSLPAFPPTPSSIPSYHPLLWLSVG